jgi:hypothetical protein
LDKRGSPDEFFEVVGEILIRGGGSNGEVGKGGSGLPSPGIVADAVFGGLSLSSVGCIFSRYFALTVYGTTDRSLSALNLRVCGVVCCDFGGAFEESAEVIGFGTVVLGNGLCFGEAIAVIVSPTEGPCIYFGPEGKVAAGVSILSSNGGNEKSETERFHVCG